MKSGMKIIKRICDKISSIPGKIGKNCPPGFDYRSEINSNGVLFGLGVGMSFQFLFRLQDAHDELFMWYRDLELGQTEPVYQIKPGAVATPFVELMEGYWWWFLPWLIALLIWVVAHYASYHRETKSIYVMRRVKKSGVILKSCVLAPLAQMGLGLLIALVVYFIDYGWYLLAMPEVCMPRFW